ncbi:hypothetical protein DERP_012235 [Dermatophagoides pteronyssinus]|uniref:Gustatory receptor n=1 Tax=Dermatophagoides pteronyssinus TaxID=6956 RepID=A0ABQ8JGF1_DERPT|nr:hypothetical protein DERP_012235 [Dermatophagoides pteronyssinus]
MFDKIIRIKRKFIENFSFNKIYFLINAPFLKAVPPIHQQQQSSDCSIIIHRITKSIIQKYYQQQLFQLKLFKRDQKIFLLIPILIFILSITRSLIVLIVNDDSYWRTWLVSMFHLLNLNRRQPEMVGLHIVIENFCLLIWLLLLNKNICLFRIILTYCHQIYDPCLNSDENFQRLKCLFYNNNNNNQNVYSKSKLLMEIDYKSIRFLAKLFKWHYHSHCFLEIISPTMVLILTIIIILSFDPCLNNFHLFNYSYLLYKLHVVIFAIFLSIWNYWGLLFASQPHLYLIFICFIMEFKHRQNKKSFHHSFIRTNSIKSLYDHRKQQSNLFNEIDLINEYFCYYISYLFLIYTSLFCQLLYVTWKSPIFSSSWLFFGGLSLYPVFVVLSLCFVIARLFQKIFDHHKYYYSLMGRTNLQINYRNKLRLMTTVTLIESRTVGFSFVDQTYIQYGTLLTIIYITATLFFQIIKRKSDPSNIEINRIYKFLNQRFFKAIKPIEIPLNRPINRLTKTDLNEYLKSIRQQPLQNEQIIFTVLPLFIFSIFIVRTIIALFIDDNSVWCTWIGSLFKLIGLKRQPPEIVGLHYVLEHIYYCCRLFGSLENQIFFRLMMSYCQQIYNPCLNINENYNRLRLFIQNNHHNDQNHLQMEMDPESLSFLSKLLKWLYSIQCLIEIISPISILLLGILTYSMIDPNENNFHLFYYSYFLYNIHLYSILIFVAYWNHLGLTYASQYYLYLIIVCIIMEFKNRFNQKQLKNITKKYDQINLIRNLMKNRKQQSNFFTEINLMNKYFSHYISYLFLIYTSLFCQLLFVTLKSTIFSTNWLFFGILSLYPAFVVLSLCFVIARLFQQIFDCHKYYHSLMSRYQFRINYRNKLRLITTINLIESRSIGFSFLDQTYIQYGTIVTIIYFTATLFLKIYDVM